MTLDFYNAPEQMDRIAETLYEISALRRAPDQRIAPPPSPRCPKRGNLIPERCAKGSGRVLPDFSTLPYEDNRNPPAL